MVSFQEAKQQISQAKLRAQEQRQQIAEARKKAKRDEQRLRESERKLPEKTQSRLRYGLYSGLEGRKRRRTISQAKQEIEGRKQLIGEFKKGLKEYEKGELKLFEKEISRKEAQVKDYERRLAEYNKHKKAIKIAKKAFYEDKPELAIYGSNLIKEYYRELKSGAEAKAKVSAPTISISQTPTISGRVTIAGKTPSQIISEQKDTLEIGLPILSFKERAEQTGGFVSVSDPYVFPSILSGDKKALDITLKKSPTRLPPLSLDISAPRDLSMTDKLKDFKSFKDSSVPSPSSFKLGKDPSNRWFITTGSPIRKTKLGSLKSRGYIPHKKPPITRKKEQPLLKPKTKKKKTKKKYEDLFLGKSKKGSKKKRNSIWGF